MIRPQLACVRLLEVHPFGAKTAKLSSMALLQPKAMGHLMRVPSALGPTAAQNFQQPCPLPSRR